MSEAKEIVASEEFKTRCAKSMEKYLKEQQEFQYKQRKVREFKVSPLDRLARSVEPETISEHFFEVVNGVSKLSSENRKSVFSICYPIFHELSQKQDA